MKLLGVPTTPRHVRYALGDWLVAVLAVAIAHVLTAGGDGALPLAERAAFLGVATCLVLYVADTYDAGLDVRRRRGLLRIWAAVAAAAAVHGIVGFLLPGDGSVPSAVAIALCLALLLPAWRAVAGAMGPPSRRRTLVVGGGPAAQALAQALLSAQDADRTHELVGFVSDEPPAGGGPPRLGSLHALEALVEAHGIEQIVVAGDPDDPLTERLLRCKARGARVDAMAAVYKRVTGKLPIRHVSGAWLALGPSFSGTRGLAAWTLRALDVALALVGGVLAAPLVAVAAVAVRLESKGPAFFFQERIGQGERPFRMVKLRTMREDAEAGTGAVWSQGAADPRVTRVGRFLRRSRIDELPQLYNVLKGEMSIVGPRPEREPFVSRLKESIPFYGLRFAVKPGVTGWAQVRYRYGASEEDAAEKLCYELYAIQEMGPALYVLILLKTVQTVLLRPGS